MKTAVLFLATLGIVAIAHAAGIGGVFRVHDVGVTLISAPVGMIDSGVAVAPRAQVRNFGDTTESFSVTFRIGTAYTNTQNVNNLGPNATRTVSFVNWVPPALGTFVTSCSTALTTDTAPGNNSLADSVTVAVRLRDATVLTITAPLDTVDSGVTVTPRAQVRNLGTSPATFPVTFRIDTLYTNTQTVTNLAPNGSQYVSFSSWAPRVLGTFSAVCTTALAGDSIPDNNRLAKSLTVVVRVRDAGITLFTAPADTVDSGVAVTPRVQVRNYGTSPVSFPVTLRIDTLYSNTQNVTGLAPNGSIYVSFASWTPRVLGSLAVTCTCALEGDANPGNNRLVKTTFSTVRVRDVAVTLFTAPADTVDSSVAVTPRVQVRNYGTSPVTFPVTLRIDTLYAGTQTVSNLGPNGSYYVNFASWVPRVLGTFPVKCTAAAEGDGVPENNALTKTTTVAVRFRDVAVLAFTAPTDTVDSGVAVTPRVQVRNLGTSPVTFPVTLRIDTLYSGVQTVTNLGPNGSVYVSFPSWTPHVLGSFAVRCTCASDGDMVPENNAIAKTTTAAVRVRDVAVLLFTAPADTVDSGVAVTPRVQVRNYGTSPVTFPVTFRIDTLYAGTQTVSNLGANGSVYVNFPSWVPRLLGTFPVKCTAAAEGDGVPENNMLAKNTVVRVRVRDVGVVAITAPVGLLDSGTAVTPRVLVRNYGSSPMTFPVVFTIDDGYTGTQTVNNLAPNSQVSVSFTTWTARVRGKRATRCSTALSGDANPVNDTLGRSVEVRVIDAGPVAIIAPTGTVDTGMTIVPRALIANFGTDGRRIPVRLSIGIFYTADTTLSVDPGEVDTFSFSPWHVTEFGTWTVKCTTRLDTDKVRTNNKITGSVTVQYPTAVEEPDGRLLLPMVFALQSIVPNPFTDRAEVRFSLPRTSAIELAIFDRTGALVRTLRSGALQAGRLRAVWDGADNSGRAAAPGVYFCRLTAGDSRATLSVVKRR